MKKKENNNHLDAWGLELGGSAVRLVHVSRTDSAYCADKYVELPLSDRWTSTPKIEAVLGKLGQTVKLTGTLAVAIPDEWVLYRWLTLPAADAVAMEKMVASQIEVMLPTQADAFTWSWARCGDAGQSGPCRVLVCAIKKESLELVKACQTALGRAPAFVFPSALALAAAWPVLHSGDDSVLLVDVAARSTSLVLLQAGKILRCAVVGEGGDHWSERISEAEGIAPAQAEAAKLESLSNGDLGQALSLHVRARLKNEVARWAQDLREAWDDCSSDLPQAQRPRRCLLVGRAALSEGLQPLVAEAMEMETSLAPSPRGLSLRSDATFDQAAGAIAAAVAALQDSPPLMNFAPAPEKVRRPASAVMRWAAVGGWLIAALLLLYLADRHQASSLASALRDAQAQVGGPGRLATARAITQYLERAAPPPMEVLEEVSALAPKQAMLTTLRYNRNGEVMIGGTVGGEQEYGEFLAKLQRSPLVSKLTPGRAVVEKDRLKFEVTFTSPAGGKAQAASAPASGPASQAAAEGGGATSQPAEFGGMGETGRGGSRRTRDRSGGRFNRSSGDQQDGAAESDRFGRRLPRTPTAIPTATPQEMAEDQEQPAASSQPAPASQPAGGNAQEQ